MALNSRPSCTFGGSRMGGHSIAVRFSNTQDGTSIPTTTVLMATYSPRLQVFHYLYCASRRYSRRAVVSRVPPSPSPNPGKMYQQGGGGVHMMIAQVVVVDRYPRYPDHRGDGANSSDFRRPMVYFHNHGTSCGYGHRPCVATSNLLATGWPIGHTGQPYKPCTFQQARICSK